MNFCVQEKSDKSSSAKALVKNSKWAKNLSRVFNIDASSCPSCEADMMIISAILEKSEIERYLDHVGLWDTGPPNILDY